VVAGVVVFPDITERKRRENILFSLVEGTSTETGHNFFKKLVKYLANALDCEYAQIGRVDNNNPNSVKSLAFWEVDKIGENFEYNLSDHPCEKAIGNNVCYYNSKVYEKFPNIKWLVKTRIESYLGIPLKNISGESIGILTVYDKKPFHKNIIDSAQSLLTVFASRAEAELQRIIADEELLEITETLRKERQELSEKNVALRQILDTMEQERREFKHEINSNIESRLIPFVKKLQSNDVAISKTDMGLLEDALKSIISKENDDFRANYNKLTSREMDICELIQQDMSSYEISEHLNISLQTVQKHRGSIRKKLLLNKKDIKLSDYLKTKNL